MHRINEVELDGKPREEILSRIPAYPGEPEMTAFESSFLCGLLREARPKKILEVGVAAGGTTAIILQCMEDLGQEYVMHSVDVLPRYYCNMEKPCGFMAEDAKRVLGSKHHQFHFGSPVVDFLDEIGGGIDFVLLDTTHALPGELMDFLVIYPYLSRNAVVCLHDVAFCQNHEWPYMHATSVLLSSVTADKIMNLVPAAGGSGSYPNIAAFRVNEGTGEDMLNIVLGLALRWVFLPSREELEHYRGMVRRCYDSSICHLFDEAARMNVGNLLHVLRSMPNGAKVALYGAGIFGRGFASHARHMESVEIVQWLDRDAEQLGQVDGMAIESPEQLDVSRFDYIVIAVARVDLAKQIRQQLLGQGVPEEKIRSAEIGFAVR